MKLSNEGTRMYLIATTVFTIVERITPKSVVTRRAIIGRGNVCLQPEILIRTCAAHKVQRREEDSNGVTTSPSGENILDLMRSINNLRSHAAFEKLPRLIILSDIITRK